MYSGWLQRGSPGLRSVLKLILLALGLLTLIGLVWHVGFHDILRAMADLGGGPILLVLLPSLLMYLVEAYGWRLTMGSYVGQVAFSRLFAIRTAGEVVNMTTPTAYIGGEPLKAYLLKRYGVPIVDGLASAIIAKTIMTLAEVLFILLGIVLSVWATGRGTHFSMPGTEAGRPGQPMAAAIVAVIFLFIATLILLALQQRGLFMSMLTVLRRCRLRIRFLESRQEKLGALDRTIKEFYTRDRKAFLLSIVAFFLGWMAEALEVFAILYFVGPPAYAVESISIAAFALIIKGGSFFIPGSIGVQEGGNVLLLMAYGYSEVSGITFAILRRIREVVWIVIGLGCLAALGGFRQPILSSHVTPDVLRKS